MRMIIVHAQKTVKRVRNQVNQMCKVVVKSINHLPSLTSTTRFIVLAFLVKVLYILNISIINAVKTSER